MYSEKKILFGQKYPSKNYLGITEGENKMKDEKISNYVKLCEDWADKFMKMDQENLRKRVPELKEENGFLTLIHFGRKYGISLNNGSICSMDGQREPDTTEMLNIYTLLGYAREGAFFMNKWVPFADLRNARPFAPAYKIGETDVFGATFSGHEKELREAFCKLGGKMRSLKPREIFFLITAPQILIMWRARYPLQMQGLSVWQSWQACRSGENRFK